MRPEPRQGQEAAWGCPGGSGFRPGVRDEGPRGRGRADGAGTGRWVLAAGTVGQRPAGKGEADGGASLHFQGGCPCSPLSLPLH